MNLQRIIRPATVLTVMLSLGFPALVWAHHSFAMFDKTKVVKLEGIIRKVEWANPHVYLFVEAKDGAGNVNQYAVECQSVNDLSHHGWKINTIKVGDHVSISIYPLRDGKPGGLFDSITLPNGTTIKE